MTALTGNLLRMPTNDQMAKQRFFVCGHCVEGGKASDRLKEIEEPDIGGKRLRHNGAPET
jgi:hypothetical protein